MSFFINIENKYLGSYIIIRTHSVCLGIHRHPCNAYNMVNYIGWSHGPSCLRSGGPSSVYHVSNSFVWDLPVNTEWTDPVPRSSSLESWCLCCSWCALMPQPWWGGMLSISQAAMSFLLLRATFGLSLSVNNSVDRCSRQKKQPFCLSYQMEWHYITLWSVAVLCTESLHTVSRSLIGIGDFHCGV